jgi:hypothetical protein
MIHNVTATRYGLDGSGIESRWGKIFHVRPERPTQPPVQRVPTLLPRGKVGGAWS